MKSCFSTALIFALIAISTARISGKNPSLGSDDRWLAYENEAEDSEIVKDVLRQLKTDLEQTFDDKVSSMRVLAFQFSDSGLNFKVDVTCESGEDEIFFKIFTQRQGTTYEIKKISFDNLNDEDELPSFEQEMLGPANLRRSVYYGEDEDANLAKVLKGIDPRDIISKEVNASGNRYVVRFRFNDEGTVMKKTCLFDARGNMYSSTIDFEWN